VAQRNVEILIGRLITDEAFRVAFLDDAHGALAAFAELGHDLTSVEIAALTAIRPDLWIRIAAEIDPRLQKASLKLR
jgi:hypothetical protein